MAILDVGSDNCEGRLATRHHGDGAGRVLRLHNRVGLTQYLTKAIANLLIQIYDKDLVVRRGLDGTVTARCCFEFADGTRAVKRVVTGDVPSRVMQPERVSSFWLAWLWPAEDRFSSESPLASVVLKDYPVRDLRFLPDGPFWIVMIFFVASMAFGAAILKPLGIQI